MIFRQPAITNLGIAINPLQPEEAPLNRASYRCFCMFQLPLYVHAFDERLTKFASKFSLIDNSFFHALGLAAMYHDTSLKGIA